MGAWRPKHVEWLCRNKTCTVLHQVGVLFDLNSTALLDDLIFVCVCIKNAVLLNDHQETWTCRMISFQGPVASVPRSDLSECVTPCNTCLTCWFSVTFTNQLRKATTYCFRHVLSLDHSSVSLSIRSEQTNRHPPGGFSWNSIKGSITSFYPH